MVVTICIRYLDTSHLTWFNYHGDLHFSALKQLWFQEASVEPSTQVTFFNKLGELIEDDLRIKEIPKLYSWTNVAQVTAKSSRYQNNKTTSKAPADRSPKNSRSSLPVRQWQVEPTIGNATFGRWIVRPDAVVVPDWGQIKFNVVMAVIRPDRPGVTWSSVKVDFEATFGAVRAALAAQLEVALAEVVFVYEFGIFYREDSRLRHATATAKRSSSGEENEEEEKLLYMQVLRDDLSHALVETEAIVHEAFRPFYDDDRLNVPLANHPLLVVHTNCDFLAPAGPGLDLDLVEAAGRPLDDPRVAAFVDGICLWPRGAAKPRRVFVMWKDGEELADTADGSHFASQTELLEAVVEPECAWRGCVVLFYCGRPLPRWKLPVEGSLALMTRYEERLEVCDGTVVRAKGQSECPAASATWVNYTNLQADGSLISARITEAIHAA